MFLLIMITQIISNVCLLCVYINMIRNILYDNNVYPSFTWHGMSQSEAISTVTWVVNEINSLIKPSAPNQQ